MAGNMVANTFATYDAKGLREDLTDVIWNVSPTETPFVTSIQKAKASNVFHEWQTDALAAASTSNAYVQGDDVASFDAVTATVRLGNYTQISRKTLIISETEEVALKAGRKSEVSYQIGKLGRELRRDIEAILLSNQAKVAPGSGTIPKTASVLSWIKTNTDKGTGAAADPSAADGTAVRTDGTTRTAAESQLKTVLSAVFSNSADQPDLLLVPAGLKPAVSAFPGNATRMLDANEKALITAVTVYESDWGSLKIVPDRFMRATDMLVINSDLWALAWFRPIKMVDLARTGDAQKKMLVCEYALEARNEKGNGGVFDVTA